MACLLCAYAEASTLEANPPKHRSIFTCVEHKMKVWYDHDTEQLLHEGHTIYDHAEAVLARSSTSQFRKTTIASSFSKLHDV